MALIVDFRARADVTNFYQPLATISFDLQELCHTLPGNGERCSNHVVWFIMSLTRKEAQLTLPHIKQQCLFYVIALARLLARAVATTLRTLGQHPGQAHLRLAHLSAVAQNRLPLRSPGSVCVRADECYAY